MLPICYSFGLAFAPMPAIALMPAVHVVTRLVLQAVELARRWVSASKQYPKAPRVKSSECGEFHIEWCAASDAYSAVY